MSDDKPHIMPLDAHTASLVEPVFKMMFDYIAAEKGVEWLRERLPIMCRAAFTMQDADGREITAVTLQAPCEVLDREH
jgi:hypothetical protein